MTMTAKQELFKYLEKWKHQNGEGTIIQALIEYRESFGKVAVLKTNELHITETKYPEQTKRFREILDEMYQTHLDKNADYSSWNINATGLIGLIVRFWDKTARIMNLSGFDIGTGEFTGAKKNLVNDESIIDSFKDAGVYSIIARIHAEGKWGK